MLRKRRWFGTGTAKQASNRSDIARAKKRSKAVRSHASSDVELINLKEAEFRVKRTRSIAKVTDFQVKRGALPLP